MTRGYTKRQPKERTDLRELEMVARIRDRHGAIVAEYTFVPNNYGYGVRIVNYFPSGDIHSHGKLTLEQFLDELGKISRERATERGLDDDQNWEEILASRPQD